VEKLRQLQRWIAKLVVEQERYGAGEDLAQQPTG
jgi:hypothetical protein